MTDCTGLYTVHAVDNADRITLLVPKTSPPELKNVILTGILAPKVARLGGNQDLIPDEPCAYEARELVRKKIIGKTIKFIYDGTVEALQRDSGRITLQDGEDIAVSLACKGLCTIQSGRGPTAYQQLLQSAFEEAKRCGLGIFASDAASHVRRLKPAPPEDPDSLLKVMRGEPQKVLVERVLGGSSLIGTLTAFDQQCAINFTGIIAPSMKAQTPELMAQESKFHTERCLLHKEVTIEFEGVSANRNFMGTVVSGTNVFSQDLLSRGFARILPSSIGNCAHRERLKTAEKQAQDNRIGLWKDYTPPQVLNAEDPNAVKNAAPQFEGEKQFEAEVVQVISGDTVLLLSGKALIKATLASVRANRVIQRDQDPGKEARISYENYTWECKEALRSCVIGKQVHVSVDYSRVIEETKELRPYVTLVLADTGLNVGVWLVGQGLARGNFSKNENACCADYIREAEMTAKNKKLGIHSGKEPSATRFVELVRPGEKKAKQYLGYFQRGAAAGRAPRLPAIIEMVLAPTSLKVYIPKEKTQITLKLAGVASPSSGMGDRPADSCAEEAKQFAIAKVQSRDVEVEIEAVDKFGNFLGSCYVDGHNFAITLVKQGLACVGNVDRLAYANELQAAQKKAQDARLNIWSEGSCIPAKMQKAQARASSKLTAGSLQCTRTNTFAPVMLTEIVDSQTFFMCALDEKTKELRKNVEAKLDAYRDNGSRHMPQRNELVVVRFSQDGRWYRGKVIGFSSDKRLANIRFIDFGNTEERCDEDIRAVGDDALLRDTPALATESRMAYMKVVTADFSDLADETLREYCSVPKLSYRPEYTINGVPYLTITSEPGAETAVQYMTRNGLAIIDQRASTIDNADVKSTLAQLLTLQQTAQRAGRNVWQYGTAVADDDDEE